MSEELIYLQMYVFAVFQKKKYTGTASLRSGSAAWFNHSDFKHINKFGIFIQVSERYVVLPVCCILILDTRNSCNVYSKFFDDPSSFQVSMLSI